MRQKPCMHWFVGVATIVACYRSRGGANAEHQFGDEFSHSAAGLLSTATTAARNGLPAAPRSHGQTGTVRN